MKGIMIRGEVMTRNETRGEIKIEIGGEMTAERGEGTVTAGMIVLGGIDIGDLLREVVTEGIDQEHQKKTIEPKIMVKRPNKKMPQMAGFGGIHPQKRRTSKKLSWRQLLKSVLKPAP